MVGWVGVGVGGGEEGLNYKVFANNILSNLVQREALLL